MTAKPTAAPPGDADDPEAAMRQQARLMALKIVVIVLGVILVAMALVVFSTLIIRIVKGSGSGASPAATAGAPAAPAAPAPGAIGTVAPAGGAAPRLPAGARVVSTALGDGRLAVTFEAGNRLTVVVVDVATGRETARFDLAPPN
ncbi:hypothetical protein [Alsobacter sp. R-9]